VLLFLLALPLYAWVVQVVNAFDIGVVVKSFGLKSGRNSCFSGSFQLGDTLVTVAESELADACRLTIYENSCVVFVADGGFVGGSVEVRVPLNPPVFGAGRLYLLVLDVYAFDYPILGACFSDSVSSVFEVLGVETKLSVEARCDGFLRCLRLCANLTDVEGYPIANETVEFLLQFRNGRRRPTDGWLPLGLAETTGDGLAKFSLAFGLPNGNYGIKAVHRGNENFGGSENVTEVEVLFNATFGGSYMGSYSVISPSTSGNLTFEVSSLIPYALLLMNGTAKYFSDARLPGPINVIFFYLDHTHLGAFREVYVEERRIGSQYVYEALLVWSPGVIGSLRLLLALRVVARMKYVKQSLMVRV